MPVCRSARRRSCSAFGKGAPAGTSNTMKSLPTPCIFVKLMRMGHRIAEPEQPSSRPIPVEASIHDREDARALGFLGGGYVDYAVLEPQRRELQADAIFHDARDMLGTPEDIDDVDFLARRQDLLQVIQIGHGALTQHGI